jgi:hypothetical protein
MRRFSAAESFRVPNPTPVVFLTNARSVIEASKNKRLHELRKLTIQNMHTS